jgi:4-hydroxy-3-methylbut-2-enyl diphosphate reductase
MKPRTIVLVSPHGFCAGVERAVELAETLLRLYPKPVYCLHEIVHNPQIIQDLASRGMVFVRDITDIPEGATALFSAHGVTPAVRAAAAARRLNTIDATCPFVTKVHAEVRRYVAEGCTVLLIGHRAHEEIIGVAGEAPGRVFVVETEAEARSVAVPEATRVAVLTQTTLSTDETTRVQEILRARFPGLRAPSESDICYATRNRQRAVRLFAHRADYFIILGARNSSNSLRLVEVAREAGCRATLVATPAEIDALPLDDVMTLGLTAGASTPEYGVNETIDRLKQRGFKQVETLSVAKEDLHFALPRL